MQTAADWTVKRIAVGGRASVDSDAALLLVSITIGASVIVAGVPAEIVENVGILTRVGDCSIVIFRTQQMS
jgi:hypothetical protein